MNSDTSPLMNLAVQWVSTQLELMTEAANGGLTAELDLLVIERGAAFHRAAEVNPAIMKLKALGLNEAELACLVTLAVVELSPNAEQYFLRLGGGDSYAALRSFVYGTNVVRAFHELGPVSRLLRLMLVDRAPADGRRTTWRIARRALTFLLGALPGDDALPDVAVHASTQIADAELIVGRGVEQEVANALRARSAIVLHGRHGLGRRSLLRKAAAREGLRVLEIDARRLSFDLVKFRYQVRCIARECLLESVVPSLLHLDALANETGERLLIVADELVSQIQGPVMATATNGTPLRWERSVVLVEMVQPTSAQRASLWNSSLGEGTEGDAKLLAERYPLAPALIVRASEAAKARANGRPLAPEDIYAGIRSVLDDRLGAFAKRVTVTQTWDDLVLPPDQLDTIVELMARVRGRTKVYEQWGFAAKVGKGLGVSALFSGPPGTGKTMVAALIARDLGLELYQVDMGKVVSKFIGETEKNLGALFDAAEAGHAILLFDEADALFGKRTDVKSSNDRYANLETNYLLQRLESFVGICLLTTNHDSHIDPAFQRRLSLHLRFELPDVDERAQLWRATLPIAAPVAGDVDFGDLARRYAMSGGYIRNAVLRAAFLAADEDSDITAAHLERAARVEYEGLGKIAA